MYTRKPKSLIQTHTLLIIILTVVTVGAIISSLVYELQSYRKPVKPSYAAEKTTAKTTSKSPTAQPNFTQGSEKGSSTPSSAATSATLTDNNGATGTPPPSSTWHRSSDSAVTVYTPASDELLRTGNSLTGSSTAEVLGFRLIDDISGVIAQGTIKVINGNFSGTLNFSTPAKNGRIDVFQQSTTGVESSNISIPVRFQ